MFTAIIAKAAKGTPQVPGDWRAAESWLKRRRRAEWGDSLDLRKLDDDTILRLLSLEAGSPPQGLEPTDTEADKSEIITITD
jgi:hypothetical protein